MPYITSNFASNKPLAPSIAIGYDVRNKTCTITTTAHFQEVPSGYDATTTLEISLDPTFSTVNKTDTFSTSGAGRVTDSSKDTVLTFPKPFDLLYIRARSVNTTDNVEGEYTSTAEFVPRTLWGVVVDSDGTKHNIVDIRKVDTSQALSPKDWIEGTLEGKEKIVEV